MTDANSILRDMFTEHVGCSLLDSGGSPKYDANGKYIGSEHGYGRHFERNQSRDFNAEPACSLKFRIYHYDGKEKLEIDFSHSTYHWLKDKLAYHEDLDSLFHGKFMEECDADRTKPWLALMEEFPEYLAKFTDEDGDLVYGEPKGIYRDSKHFTENTYNHETLLDQTLQFTYFTFENSDEEFVALQVHGGADVRGGYTQPRIFRVQDELAVLEYARASIRCTGENHHPDALKLKHAQENQVVIPGVQVSGIDFDSNSHYWTTDDGCHWYSQGCCGVGYDQLEKSDLRDLNANDSWEPGVLCIKDGIGYCPVCGARLEGCSY